MVNLQETAVHGVMRLLERQNTGRKLKQEGVIIYTVGLGLTSTAKGWLDGSQPIWDGNKNISGIASKDCALTAESIDELKEIFKRIQETITNNLDIKSAQIKDVIDPRFEILDDEGQPITKDYPGIKDGIKLKNGGTVFYDSETGYQYIVWNEQTIPNAEKGKWNKTITVRAKDTYIGVTMLQQIFPLTLRFLQAMAMQYFRSLRSM